MIFYACLKKTSQLHLSWRRCNLSKGSYCGVDFKFYPGSGQYESDDLKNENTLEMIKNLPTIDVFFTSRGLNVGAV